jgi:hypothetical protein
MRRIALISLALAALAAPAAAVAAGTTALDDGVLVVKNASAPKGTAVVELTITGSVIGQTTDQSRIVIDTGPKGAQPEVTSATQVPVKNPDLTPTAQAWASPDGLKFRIVGATKAVVLIYGSGVNLVAIGTGTVTLAGMPADPSDGWFAINGGDHHSMPGQPLKQLIAGDDS